MAGTAGVGAVPHLHRREGPGDQVVLAALVALEALEVPAGPGREVPVDSVGVALVEAALAVPAAVPAVFVEVALEVPAAAALAAAGEAVLAAPVAVDSGKIEVNKQDVCCKQSSCFCAFGEGEIGIPGRCGSYSGEEQTISGE